MTTVQQLITIAAVILGTMTTRFLAFIIFPEGKHHQNSFHTWVQFYPMRLLAFSLFIALKMLCSLLSTVYQR